MKLTTTFFACILAAALSGCASAPEIPLSLRYQPPRSEVETLPTIKGTQRSGGMLDAFTTFVALVDGKRVMGGRKGWNQPLPLSPGTRIITVEFNRGVFVARADMELDASPGKSYAVRFDTDVKLYGKNSYCDFWIADTTTDQPVTAIKRGTIEGGSGGGFVPIFIPSG